MPVIAVVYPSTLPGPSVGTLQPDERRLLSDLPGVQQVRGIQRDYLGVQTLEWSLLDATKAAAWLAWWQQTLEFGLAWFSATWPLPAGWTSAVRRFLAPPKWEHLPGGFWRVSAQCELRGRGLPPVQRPLPLLGLHFDGGITDTSGHPTAYHSAGFGYTDPVIVTASPKFGSGDWLHGPITNGNVLISDNRGGLALNASGLWQIEFWCKPNASAYGYNGGGVVSLINGGPGGTGFSGVPLSSQITVQLVRLSGDLTKAWLSVTYVTGDTGGGIAGPWNLHANDAFAYVPVDGAWHHVAIVGDATSTRGYIDGVQHLDDGNPSLPALPGAHPLYAAAGFVDQYFVVGQLFAGYAGIYTPADWTFGALWTNGFDGEIDDLRVTRGCDYTGASFTPPAASPF